MEIYEERLRQKNALISQVIFQNELNAEDLKNYQKIIKDQQNEIRKLYEDLRTKGHGMMHDLQAINWLVTMIPIFHPYKRLKITS